MRVIEPEQLSAPSRRLRLCLAIVGRAHQKAPPRPFLGRVGQGHDGIRATVPADQRAAWRAIFDHYVFSADESVAAHIPVHRRSVLGEISPKLAAEVRAFLVGQLDKKD